MGDVQSAKYVSSSRSTAATCESLGNRGQDGTTHGSAAMRRRTEMRDSAYPSADARWECDVITYAHEHEQSGNKCGLRSPRSSNFQTKQCCAHIRLCTAPWPNPAPVASHHGKHSSSRGTRSGAHTGTRWERSSDIKEQELWGQGWRTYCSHACVVVVRHTQGYTQTTASREGGEQGCLLVAVSAPVFRSTLHHELSLGRAPSRLPCPKLVHGTTVRATAVGVPGGPNQCCSIYK